MRSGAGIPAAGSQIIYSYYTAKLLGNVTLDFAVLLMHKDFIPMRI